MLRLDAAPFLWKRMGTDCPNQPETHQIVRAFRALTRLAAPGLVLKAEAIVSLEMLVQYLGGHDRFRPECDLAYDNQLRVMLWSTLAYARRSLLALRPGGHTELLPTENRSVLTYRRVHPRSASFLALTNFRDITQPVDAGIIARAGLYEPEHVHSSTGQLSISAGRIELPPWGFVWLAGILNGASVYPAKGRN